MGMAGSISVRNNQTPRTQASFWFSKAIFVFLEGCKDAFVSCIIVASLFLTQASLVETVTDVRPGVTVQEFSVPEDGSTKTVDEPEIVRMKAGPAELQVPGRLSRSAYKVPNNNDAAF